MKPDVAPAALPPEPSPETLAAHHKSQKKWQLFQRVKSLLFVIGGILVGALLVVVTILVSVIVSQNKKLSDQGSQLIDIANTNKANGVATRQATQILVDCTTPGHPCYERSKATTKDTVEQLTKTNAAIDLCVRDHPEYVTIKDLEGCVSDRLAGH